MVNFGVNASRFNFICNFKEFYRMLLTHNLLFATCRSILGGLESQCLHANTWSEKKDWFGCWNVGWCRCIWIKKWVRLGVRLKLRSFPPYLASLFCLQPWEFTAHKRRLCLSYWLKLIFFFESLCYFLYDPRLNRICIMVIFLGKTVGS